MHSKKNVGVKITELLQVYLPPSTARLALDSLSRIIHVIISLDVNISQLPSLSGQDDRMYSYADLIYLV